MGAYKSAGEVAAALAKPYSGRVSTREGRGGQSFTYIAWTDTARELTAIFGPFGWSERVTFEHSDTRQGIYSVTREISATVLDDETGEVRTITRTGKGAGIAVPNKAGDLTAESHDTAIKAADSDSFSRAAKKLGDALGLSLYGGGESTAATVRPAATGGKSSGGDLGYRPSPKQLPWLLKAGYTQEQVDTMTFAQWKNELAVIFGSKDGEVSEIAPAGKAAGKAKPVAKQVADDDDDLFGNVA